MDLRKNRLWSFFLVFWLLSAVLPLPLPAAACQPSLPNAYFEEITIEQGNLPADIVVERVNEVEWWIHNNGEQVIYVVHPQTSAVLQPSTPEATPALAPLAAIEPSGFLPISWVRDLSEYAPQLTDWNSESVRKPPGTPADQDGWLAFEMGGRVYQAPVHVHYTVNPDYQKILDRACSPLAFLPDVPAGPYVCIPLLCLLPIAGLVIVLVRRSSRSKAALS